MQKLVISILGFTIQFVNLFDSFDTIQILFTSANTFLLHLYIYRSAIPSYTIAQLTHRSFIFIIFCFVASHLLHMQCILCIPNRSDSITINIFFQNLTNPSFMPLHLSLYTELEDSLSNCYFFFGSFRFSFFLPLQSSRSRVFLANSCQWTKLHNHNKSLQRSEQQRKK